MSNEWDEMNEELPAEELDDKGIANLRKAYDRKVKAEKELRDKLADLESRERVRTLSEALSAKGVNPKLANLYPAGQDATPEKVDEWLSEYAEAFGQAPPRQTPAQPQVSPELRDIYNQFQTPGMNSPTQDEESSIRNYTFGDPSNSEAEVQKFMSWMRNHPGAINNPGA
jgi:hypothetical protein